MSAAAGAPDQATAEYRACADYVRARCKRIAECGVYGESFCLESALPLCPDWIFGPGSNNTPELIAQCATDWMTAPCTVFQTYTPVCIYAPGDFENGEACISDAQCKSGLCSGSDTFCGTCQRVLELGESCADGSTGMCAYGSDCNGTTCVPRRGSALPPGTACETTYLLCATGYVCRADGTGQTTCQEPLAPGATCVDYDCSPYHFCDPATHVCTPNPPAGMPCGDSGIGACAEHAYCNRSADPPVCVVRAALGGTCFDDPDLTDVQGNCEAGLFCVCDAGEDCTDGVCMTRASEGEACGDATTFCVEGTACRSGKCTVSGLAGDYAETCMK